MVKVILDAEDIKKLINNKYPGAVVVSGLENMIDIIIKVEEIKTTQQVIQPPTNKASELALENRENTIPGGAMGKQRGELPRF